MKYRATPHADHATDDETRAAVRAAEPSGAVALFGVETYFKGRPVLYYCRVTQPDGSQRKAVAATTAGAFAIASTEIVSVLNG